MHLRAISLTLAIFVSLLNAVQATELTASEARIAIVIDDLGDRWREGRQAIDLPGDITVGIIPFTPYARRLAEQAEDQHKEIMLHLPMEAMADKYLGRGGLHSAMKSEEFFAALHNSLRFLPNIRGVNNHMGSRLTQDTEKMHWLMQGLQQHGELYFLDSRTVDSSQAMQAAIQSGVPAASRDVFLDHNRDPAAMQKQWSYLQRLAKENGSAVCIAHPYPQSLNFLREHIPGLHQQGITLLRVSELIAWRQDQDRRNLAWQTSTSLSR